MDLWKAGVVGQNMMGGLGGGVGCVDSLFSDRV